MQTPDDSGSLSPPTTIGPFRVLHQVGVGVLGPVFRAHDPDRDALVAIKLFKVDLVPEQAHRLADVLGQLRTVLPRHPGLVPVVATGVEGTTAWLAEDYVPFDSVDTRLRRRAVVTLPEILPLVNRLAAAIDAAAAAGVCHGALHPRDVLVSTTGETRITGFGVAEALVAVGLRPPARRPYAAPERLAGGAFDVRADVFGLGAIVFELLAGRRLAGTGAAAVSQLTALGLGVDVDACRRALAAALDETPARRLSSAGTLAQALAQAAGESFAPGLATSAMVPPRAVRPAPPPLAPSPPAATLPPDAEPLDLPLAGEVPVAAPEGPPRGPIDLAVDADTAAGGVPAIAVAPPDLAADTRTMPAGVLPRVSEDEPFPPDEAVTDDAPPRGDDPEAVAPVSPPPPRTPVDATPAGQRFAWGDEGPARAGGASRITRTVTRVPLSGLVAAALVVVAIGLYWWGSRSATPVASPGDAPAPAPVETEEVVDEVPALPAPPRATPTPAPARQPPPAASARTPAVPPPAPAPAPAPVRPAVSGPIDIVSRPAGARVVVDGQPAGRSPLRLPSLATGSHTIRLELDGYAPWTTTIELEPGEPRRVAASLEGTRQR